MEKHQDTIAGSRYDIQTSLRKRYTIRPSQDRTNPFYYVKRSQASGGRDLTPVRGVPYEPIALLRVYRAKIESNSR
jgi:hypothetical protein